LLESVNAPFVPKGAPAFFCITIVLTSFQVSVASLAAFLSAHGYHSAIQKARRRRPMRRSNATTRQEQRGTTEAPASVRHDESVELTAFHAIVFLIMASTALLTLFFLKIYNVVKALYALGCAEAFSQVVVDPIVRRVMARFRLRNPVVFRSVADFENVSVRDVVSHLLGHVLGISWLLVAFTNAHPEEVPFVWVVQNVFGACMCM
jgi:predicted membrane protein